MVRNTKKKTRSEGEAEEETSKHSMQEEERRPGSNI